MSAQVGQVGAVALMDTIKAKISSINEPHKGYQDDLFLLISEIVHLENQHAQSGMNIQQKITDRIDAYGKDHCKKAKQTGE